MSRPQQLGYLGIPDTGAEAGMRNSELGRPGGPRTAALAWPQSQPLRSVRDNLKECLRAADAAHTQIPVYFESAWD